MNRDDVTRPKSAPAPGNPVRGTEQLLELLESVSTARESTDRGLKTLQRALCKACADALDLRGADQTPAFRLGPFTRLRADEIWVDRTGSPFQPPPSIEGTGGADSARVLDLGDGRGAAVVPVCLSVEDGASLGRILAMGNTGDEARGFLPELEALASVLAHALGLLRELTDRRAMIRLSEELSRVQDAGEVLERTAQIIKDHIQADGLKVFVLRRDPTGEILELLYRTDREQEGPRRDPLDPKCGLANWVVLHNDWVLINEPVPGGDAGTICEQALTGRHGDRVEILAKEENDNNEKAILIVPLRIEDRCVGALTVWRESPGPFDRNIDRASLEALASQVAVGCRFRVQREYTRRVTEAIASVTQLAAEADPHREIHRTIARKAGDLSSAEGVILMMRDGNSAVYFPAGDWWRDPETAPECTTVFPVERGGKTARSLYAAVGTWLEEIPERTGRPGLRCVLPLEDDSGFLVLFDGTSSPGPDASRLSFDEENREPALRLFVEGINPVLTTHPAAFAFKVADEFSGATTSTDSEIDVLGKAAEILRNATGCTAVLVYSEDGEGRMTLRKSAPTPDHEVFPDTPIPFLETVIRKRRTRRILDVGYLSGPANPEASGDFTAIAEVFGWSIVRSVLGQPVVVGDRCVGLIVLLSDEDGPFLGPCHEETVRGVAVRAAREMEMLRRREVLSKINKVVDRLAALNGEKLAGRMAGELEGWCRSVIRPGLDVVVTASVDSENPRVFSVSETLTGDAPSIEKRSADHRNEDFTMKLKRSRQLLGVPLGLHGVRTLWGHLCIVGKGALDIEGVKNDLREGAREISILLDGERRRRNWFRQMGRFRHAVFGAAQGLVSASRETLYLAERFQLTPREKERLSRRISAEAETVRLWKENQRLYAGDGVQIRKRSTDLKRVVERVIRRWDDIAKDRDLAITLEWKTRGNLVFGFDEQGLDIALSNLLDNALKYSFANKTIDVSVEIVGDMVRIVVEDFGHPIPDRLKDAIFEEGTRMDWEDRTRSITGSGLGLPMARRIIGAHGGALKPESESKGLGRNGKTERAVVRFIIELPFEGRLS